GRRSFTASRRCSRKSASKRKSPRRTDTRSVPMVVLARSAFRASGEFAGRNALLPRFIIKRIELGLQILLLILDGANLHLDGFALITLVEPDATGVGRRLAGFEVLQVGDLLVQVDHLKNLDRKSTRLNSSHVSISYAVFCLKKKKKRSQDHLTS